MAEKIPIFAHVIGYSVVEEVKRVKRKRPSSLPAVISMALVLFLMGLLGVLVIDAKKISDYFLENVQIDIYFKEEAIEKDALTVKLDLDKQAYTKETRYVTKEDAANRMRDQLGQNFEEVLGYNPMPYSIELMLKAHYASPARIEEIKADLGRNPMIEEVVYQNQVLENVMENIRNIGLWLGVLVLIFLVVAIGLINSTIRLGIFARRFLIKSMQLVGATEWFITRPFIGRAVLHGFYGWILANLLLGGLIYGIIHFEPDMLMLVDYNLYGIVSGGLLVLSIVISTISAFFSTKKYLRTKIDDLY